MLADLYKEMKVLTLEAGIKEKRYDNVFMKARDSQEIEQQLNQIYRLEYKGVVEIKSLLKPEVWERYKAMGVEKLREQIILESRQKALRKAWTNIQTNNTRNKNIKENENETEHERITQDSLGESI